MVTSMGHGHVYLLGVVYAKDITLSYFVHVLDTLTYQGSEFIVSISFKTGSVAVMTEILIA